MLKVWRKSFLLSRHDQMKLIELYNKIKGTTFTALWEIGSDICSVDML